MMHRSVPRRIVLLVAAASVLCFALATAGHLHQQTTLGAAKELCQLCALSQVRIHLTSALPVLTGLVLVAWVIVEAQASPLQANSQALPSPRGPPLR